MLFLLQRYKIKTTPMEDFSYHLWGESLKKCTFAAPCHLEQGERSRKGLTFLSASILHTVGSLLFPSASDLKVRFTQDDTILLNTKQI